MKIKIRKNAPKKKKDKTKKIAIRRIRLPNTIRLAIIGVIILLLLYSAINVYAAYQKPETTTNTIPVVSYYQNGQFEYKAYLKDNTIYPDKEYLLPEEGIYFKNIIKNITTSFTYSFNSDKTAEISGSYTLSAEIQTSIWNKNYLIAAEDASGNFKGDGRNAEFTIEPFEVDLDYYEGIVSKIEAETGVTVSSPKLEIKCVINVFAKVSGKTIYKTFTPSILFTLKTKQIEISEPVTNYQSNVETEKHEEYHLEVVEQRNSWTLNSYVALFVLFLVLLITRSNLDKLDKIDKNIKKINKKYGEWIVEIERQPPTKANSDTIYMKTLEDLMKISEELGKPVLHYYSTSGFHYYYIIHESTQYQFKL